MGSFDGAPLVDSLDAVAEAAFACSADGRVVAWNGAAERMLGLRAGLACGDLCAHLIAGVDRRGIPVCMEPCPLLESPLLNASPRPIAHPDLATYHADGGRLDLTVVALPAVLGDVPVLIHILRDSASAPLDALTGTLDRHAFTTRVALLQDEALRRRLPLSIALVDVDGLSRVNARDGWPGGDNVLGAVAACLRLGGRDDVITRWGGDEFAIAFPGQRSEDAAAQLRRSLDLYRRRMSVGDRGPGFSAGVTDLDPSMPMARELARAQRLLDQAKHDGGGRVVQSPR